MHAHRIIQDFLADQCPSMHAKRRHCLAAMTEAARRGGLRLLKMSKAVQSETALRHRIKRCDRLLSNPHLARERTDLYRALAHRVLRDATAVAIVVAWSGLLRDVDQ